MSLLVLLDTGPLGLLTNPKATPQNLRCAQWLRGLTASGVRVVLPEIADYEIRRELIRVNKTQGLERLDTLKSNAEYVPLTTETMLLAAEFWAVARQRGRPTADDKALDGDMILAAQAVLLRRGGDDPVIATTNVRHLSLFADAREWMTIEAL